MTREMLAAMPDDEFTQLRSWVEQEEDERYERRMIAHIKALARDIGLKVRLRRMAGVTPAVPADERIPFL